MIDRLFVTKMKRYARQFPVIAITGPRQIGKSTLAKLFAAETGRYVVFYDLENPADYLILSDQAQAVFENQREQLVVIDEVQRLKALFPLLRYEVDQYRKPLRFLLLGSASPDLIRDSSESLAGRIAFMELSGLLPPETGIAGWRDLWLRGGYPSVYLQDDPQQRKDWLENYINTYVQRDLPMLGMPADPGNSLRLLFMLAHLNGQILNMSTLARSLGLSVNTIKTYLYFLENAGIIRLLKPWAENAGKRLVRSPKVYIRDSGLLHYLFGVNSMEELLRHPGCGASFEGFIIEKTLSMPDTGYEGYFYHEHRRGELDLLLVNRANISSTVEIKMGVPDSPGNVARQMCRELNAAENLIVSASSNKNIELTDTLKLVTVESYFNRLAAP